MTTLSKTAAFAPGILKSEEVLEAMFQEHILDELAKHATKHDKVLAIVMAIKDCLLCLSVSRAGAKHPLRQLIVHHWGVCSKRSSLCMPGSTCPGVQRVQKSIF